MQDPVPNIAQSGPIARRPKQEMPAWEVAFHETPAESLHLPYIRGKADVQRISEGGEWVHAHS